MRSRLTFQVVTPYLEYVRGTTFAPQLQPVRDLSLCVRIEDHRLMYGRVAPVLCPTDSAHPVVGAVLGSDVQPTALLDVGHVGLRLFNVITVRKNLIRSHCVAS